MLGRSLRGALNDNKGEDMLTLEDVAKAFELYLLYGDDEGITQVVFEESGGDLHTDDSDKPSENDYCSAGEQP